MKFAKVLKNIFLTLTIIALISMSTAKRSSRSKTRVKAETQVVNYEAELTIKDASNTETHQIKIDQESFNQMEYGIKFSMEKGSIANHAFFTVSANTYLFDFVHAHNFNCVDQASFTQQKMHFSVHQDKKNYEVIFTFPNGWAFANNANILSLCNKFYDKWNTFKSKRDTLKAEIIKLYNHINLLEQQKAQNIKNKNDLQTLNNNLQQQAVAVNATILASQQKIETITNEIKTIGYQQAAESEKLNKIEAEITTTNAKIANQQKFIDDAQTNINSIKSISQDEINNEWGAFGVVLDKMIAIHSSDDSLKNTLTGYKSNVQSNAANIMKTLNDAY